MLWFSSPILYRTFGTKLLCHLWLALPSIKTASEQSDLFLPEAHLLLCLKKRREVVWLQYGQCSLSALCSCEQNCPECLSCFPFAENRLVKTLRLRMRYQNGIFFSNGIISYTKIGNPQTGNKSICGCNRTLAILKS